MRVELTEMVWFDEHVLSLGELASISGLPEALLEELSSCGAVAPLDPAASELRFGAVALRAARAAQRLRTDFELDTQSLLLALGLLDRIEELERQLRDLKARAPRRLR